MRITGGKLKGRIIKCPDGVIRPAMDRMRESVFAILGDLTGKSWLDLFSGSGTIAIEAVSRGASSVELCEKDRIKVNTVLENVSVTEKECGVKIQCHFMPVEYFIKRCKSQFDYIFFDPPFPYKFNEQLIADLVETDLIESETSFVTKLEYNLADDIDKLSAPSVVVNALIEDVLKDPLVGIFKLSLK